ncbi:MAG: hypothetical protein H0U07_12490 [Actinobacteria bacterium]|nr:hypothetical protein [Actinomycetota bacterium]
MVLAVLAGVALMVGAAVALYNRPRLLVAPHLRELPGAVDEWRGVAVVEPAAAEADPRAADADPTVGRESTASRTAMRRDPPWDRRAALSRVPVNFTFDKD